VRNIQPFVHRFASFCLLARIGATLAVATAVALSTGAPASAADDDDRDSRDTIIFTVDVAEDFGPRVRVGSRPCRASGGWHAMEAHPWSARC
jgi:hypothetical protein